MSDLHEELYNQLAKRGLPMPNIFPFDLLKDVTVETMAIEYIEKQLIDGPLDESLFDLFHITSDDAIVSYPSIQWQKYPCTKFDIPFDSSIETHSSLDGQRLQNYKPWRNGEIIGNGNCFFRYKIISGTERHHFKLR